MPSESLGYSSTDLIAMLKQYTGNKSNDFETYLNYEIPLAEFRYCKLHDWSFLYQSNLSLAVTTGTDEYPLSSTSLGYYMAASDVITVRDVSNNRVLRKTTVDDIRRRDANSDDGNSSTGIELWAPIGDNRILVYPGNFSTTTLRIDGKITPAVSAQRVVQGLTYSVIAATSRASLRYVHNAVPSVTEAVSVASNVVTVTLATDGSGNISSTNDSIKATIEASASVSAVFSVSGSGSTPVTAQSTLTFIKYLTIPYRYQDTYIEWLKGVVLDRENDSRAMNQRNYAAGLVRKDIEDDLAGLGDTVLPRIRASWEQALDGSAANMDELYNLWAFYSE